MDEHEYDTRVRSRIWKDGRLVGESVPRERLLEAIRDPQCLVWVDIVDADPESLRRLADALELTETELEDAFAPYERPKVSRHGAHLFFTAYTAGLVGHDGAADHDSRLAVHRVSGFLLPAALLTIHTSSFDMGPVVQRWDENTDMLEHGPRALVHGLLDVVVDGHFEAIQLIDDEIEVLEDDLFEEKRTGPEFLRRTYRLRKELVGLRRVVLPMREVVNGLLRHGGRTNTELDAWFDDLYDHVLRASEWTESLRDMITSVFETNLSLQDARLNQVMRQLAAWAAIIAVPTAITGWFGQNIPYWGFQEPLGLWLSVGLIALSTFALWVVFRRRKWL